MIQSQQENGRNLHSLYFFSILKLKPYNLSLGCIGWRLSLNAKEFEPFVNEGARFCEGILREPPL